jgi:putative endonuclease
MPTTKEIGDYFEAKAKDFYTNNGYDCLAQNYRFGKREIDLIFKREKLLIFVEVKYRNSMAFGFPEDWVTVKKQTLLEECASYFIEEYDWHGNIRFDIVAYLKKGNKAERQVFIDVFG